MATQNPIEQEGTYPLPEAQLDRFMLKIKVGYPTREEERQIMDRMTASVRPHAEKAISPEALLRARDVVSQIYVDEKISDYIVDLVSATRDPDAHWSERDERVYPIWRQPKGFHLPQPSR